MGGEETEMEHAEPENPGNATPVVVNSKDKADESHRSKNVAKEWLAKFSEPLIIVTLLLFGATVALYCATRDLVHDAKDTAERQLRAYVYIKEATADFADNKVWSARIVFRNFGQTPAYQIGTPTNFFPAAIAESYDFPSVPLDLVASESDIGPGQEISVFARANKAFTTEEAANFRAGKWVIFVRGRVTYRDAFGNDRFTQFSMRYAPEHGGFDALPIGGNRSN